MGFIGLTSGAESMMPKSRTVRGRLRQMLTVAVLAMPWLLGGCAGTPTPQALVVTPGPPPSIAELVREASARFNMPVTWINAVMRQESGGRAHAVSPKGAMGLMQLMPATWNYLRRAYKLGDDPYDPHDNIIAGTAYLREMYDLYGSPGFLAAYNAGPGRYESCVRKRRPLPPETRHYVAMIAPRLDGAVPDGPSPTRPVALALLPPVLSPPPSPPPAQLLETSVAVAPPPRPLPVARDVFASAAPQDEDDESEMAPRPGRSPVLRKPVARGQVASRSAPPRPPALRQVAQAGDHHLPEHRPPLPPGWYVPVNYAHR